jgi:hypothetical protein
MAWWTEIKTAYNRVLSSMIFNWQKIGSEVSERNLGTKSRNEACERSLGTILK